MKKFVSILVGLMILPLFAFGAAYDVTLNNSGAQITIGSNTFVLSGRESVMNSMTVSATDISIVTTAGVFFQVTSADKLDFTVSPSEYKTSFECQASQSVLTVSASQDISTTITVTPGSACTSDSGGGGSGGGGGGGGSSYSYAATTPAPAPVPSVPKAPTVAQPSAIAQAVSPVFNKNLARGARNDDVKRVQQLLTQDKTVYPEGLATGFFGPATEKAVRNFQIKYGVIKKANDPGNGKLGPKTRAKLAEVYGSSAAAPAAPAPVSPPAGGPAPAPTPAPASDNSTLQSQIQNLLKQIEVLQAQLKTQSAPAPKPQSPLPFLIGT